MKPTFGQRIIFAGLTAALLGLIGISPRTFAGCAPLATGLVSWWRAEGNPQDAAGTNDGTLVGNPTYGTGQVGSAFVLDGVSAGFNLGRPASLQLQNFTIEAWIQRADPVVATFGTVHSASFLVCGPGGYGFGIWDDGRLFLTQVEVGYVASTNTITDTGWHHVAVTKSGSAVVFYVDGAIRGAFTYNPTFSFGTDIGLGVRGDTLENSFYGAVDELSVFNRGLSAAEIQALYTASSEGKCPSPVIYTPPANQTNFVGDTATIPISAGGARPLTYQWSFNGTSLEGATDAVLVMPSLQLTQGGNYTVTITNDFGATNSTPAHLTVLATPPCTPLPTNLVSWWRANGNALDSVGGNHGTLVGNATYANGRVGPAFTFDGTGDAVQLGNPPFLQLQNFSIETWIKRASTAAVSGSGDAVLFGYGQGGYAVGMFANGGSLFLTKLGIAAVSITNSITDTNWHHVAVTKQGTNVVFYIDGSGITAGPFDPGFTFGTAAAIGARGDNSTASFLGQIDELSVSARALNGAEIRAIYNASAGGKCFGSVPPFFFATPSSQTNFVGSNTTFTVTAAGSVPLSYQWRFNGTNLAGATDSALTLTNLQLSQAGSYSVAVSNLGGVTMTSNAQLTLIYPPAVVRAANLSVISGGLLTVPIQLVATGNENALTFSLSFSTQWLAFSGVTVGSATAGASLVPHTSQTSSGRLGVALALPPGGVFAPGTQEVARVTFSSAIWLGPTATNIGVNFSDLPWTRQLSDLQDAPLLVGFSNGVVSLFATELEGDLSPRPNGNRVVDIVDYAQAGRFAARLDPVAPGVELQHADSAPRATRGDGQIKVTDWVQAGRYFFGLDPLTVLGGPTTETPPPPGPFGGPRELRVATVSPLPGDPATLPIIVQALGGENAFGFSLVFDPAKFGYLSIAPGADISGATLYVNPSLIASGKLGVAFALPPGNGLAAGPRELLKLTLTANGGAGGNNSVSFDDQPVPRSTSDVAANELSASYVAGGATANAAPSPTLGIGCNETNLMLWWPASAADFNLQSRTNAWSGNWSNVAAVLQTNGSDVVTVQPITGDARFFRLFHP